MPPALERRLGFAAATMVNVLTMIGAGPFITIPLLLQTMGGPQAMLGWITGAIIAISDGLVWAELGAAMPRSGGGYQYLLEIYSPQRLGRLMSFLFLWQAVVSLPLALASGAVGFSHYATFLYPAMTPWQSKGLAVGVCLLSMMLIYRRIDSVGRWGIAFGFIVLVVAAWIIGEGVLHARLDRIALPPDAWRLSHGFWLGLGSATLYAMYDYAGYNNVCNVAEEVVRPETTIPRSIVVAVLAVGALYLAMNVTIISVMPWREAMRSQYVVSDFIAQLHQGRAASVMTVLILVTILAGLFGGMLGASRIPYAAAADGRFFRIFARLHPTGRFPSFSVLFIGVASAICCLLELNALITALMVVYIIIGAIPMVAAATTLRRSRPDIQRPFQMWLYPLPSLVACAGWIYIVATSGLVYILAGLGLLAVGIGAYLWRSKRATEWPFHARLSHGGN
jgi:amino acid transporter